jgi:hypothetical protein
MTNAEIEAATKRLHNWRKAMWKKKLSGPEIEKPPDRPKKPDVFVTTAIQKKYSRYERENR